MTENTTQTGRELSERLNPGMEDALNARYLADILDRIHDHKINRLDELLPWNWTPLASVTNSQAA